MFENTKAPLWYIANIIIRCRVVQTVIGFIVWAFRRLKKRRCREMSARSNALHSVCPQLSFFFVLAEDYYLEGQKIYSPLRLGWPMYSFRAFCSAYFSIDIFKEREWIAVICSFWYSPFGRYLVTSLFAPLVENTSTVWHNIWRTMWHRVSQRRLSLFFSW